MMTAGRAKDDIPDCKWLRRISSWFYFTVGLFRLPNDNAARKQTTKKEIRTLTVTALRILQKLYHP
jgi:hypothetical protein